MTSNINEIYTSLKS